MSRIAKQPVIIPKEVTVEVTGSQISVSGPKGNLTMSLPVQTAIQSGQLTVTGQSHLAGMARTMISNMVKGVTVGWDKTLELSGTGYRASVSGEGLNLALGFSHPVVVPAPQGITFEVKENKIKISGRDREKIGLIAAKIRRLRPADPYKAKGFKYEGEVIVKKAGKAAKAGATTAK